jgi:hypothetical protein
LGYILVAAIVTVISRMLVERGWASAVVAGLNHRVEAMVATSFVASNVLLIGAAVRGG